MKTVGGLSILIGLVLLIGGFLGARIVRVRATAEAPSGRVSEHPRV